MKNSKLNLVLCSLFFAALFTFSSCSKDNDLSTTQLSAQKTDFKFLETNVALAADVSLVNGILKFDDLSGFRSSVLALNRMTPDEQAQWSQSLGFQSMQQTFNAIMLTEFELAGHLNSELYTENMRSGLIVADQTTGLYKLNIFNPAYAPVLNKQGLVMIDNALYHFAGSTLKSWEEADLSHPETLLATNENTEQIKVFPMSYEAVNLRNTSTWTEECASSTPDSEMYLSGFFSSEFIDAELPDALFVDYYINIQTLVLNGDEMEFDPEAVLVYKGKSKTDFTVTDGNEEFVKPFEKRYKEAMGVGGNFTFIPEVAGEYQTNAPWYFTNPARLMQNWWWAMAKTSTGSVHECEIAL